MIKTIIKTTIKIKTKAIIKLILKILTINHQKANGEIFFTLSR